MQIAFLILGATLGAVLAFLYFQGKLAVLQTQLQTMEIDKAQKEDQLQRLQAEKREIENSERSYREKCSSLEAQLSSAQARQEELQKQLSELTEENRALWNEKEAIRIELTKLEKDREAIQKQIEQLQALENRMKETFSALSNQVLSDALTKNTEHFVRQASDTLDRLLSEKQSSWSRHEENIRSLLQQAKEDLAKLDKEIRELETKRESAYKGLEQYLNQLASTNNELKTTTTKLVEALKSPRVSGSWGEIVLQQVVEAAGMKEYISYDVQPVIEGGLRPDMLIHLPNQRKVAIDAKFPLTDYLNSIDHQNHPLDELKNHIKKALKTHIENLAKKAYWKHIEDSVDFVILFVPNDAILVVALQDNDLYQKAANEKIILASPFSLLPILKSISYGWQQYKLSENAKAIAQIGGELYERLITFVYHLQELGKRLEATVKAYNESIGSLEHRLIPAGKKIKELSGKINELPLPKEVSLSVQSPKSQHPSPKSM